MFLLGDKYAPSQKGVSRNVSKCLEMSQNVSIPLVRCLSRFETLVMYLSNKVSSSLAKNSGRFGDFGQLFAYLISLFARIHDFFSFLIPVLYKRFASLSVFFACSSQRLRMSFAFIIPFFACSPHSLLTRFARGSHLLLTRFGTHSEHIHKTFA